MIHLSLSAEKRGTWPFKIRNSNINFKRYIYERLRADKILKLYHNSSCLVIGQGEVSFSTNLLACGDDCTSALR